MGAGNGELLAMNCDGELFAATGGGGCCASNWRLAVVSRGWRLLREPMESGDELMAGNWWREVGTELMR